MRFGVGLPGASESLGSCPYLIPSCPRVEVNGNVIQYVAKLTPFVPEMLANVVPEGARGGTYYACTRPACLSNPCPPDEVCEETTTGFSCQINETACLSNPCPPDEVCEETTTGFSCQVNETACLSNPCPPDEVCEETTTGFSCQINETDRHLRNVSLLGGSDASEGRVGFTADFALNENMYMSRYAWPMQLSHKVCRHFGFTGAAATLSGNIFHRSYAEMEDPTVGGGANGLVTSFKISYGPKETELTFYEDAVDGIEMVFPGNYDSHTPVTTSFTPYILAKYFRIHPKSSVTSVSMRFELIGYGPLPDDIGELKLPFYR
ncbi:EGF-like repeat and discoidin I-like domain-containing protein 3 [Lytechinus pictus]|uniref:EGF-like repeat and discoidin I-like domain-containing protein 3 n=1 Tax=Lytechinus pictus TaxID=7653 RepID=UPI0030B9DE81